MAPEPKTRATGRPARLRPAVVGVLALLAWGLAGCGDPDDGDGGGGYVTGAPTVEVAAPAAG